MICGPELGRENPLLAQQLCHDAASGQPGFGTVTGANTAQGTMQSPLPCAWRALPHVM